MVYPVHFEQKIGFDQIRALLMAACASSLGKEKVEAMSFLTDFDSIQEQLNRSHEFVSINTSTKQLPDCYFIDARNALKKAKIEGHWLDEQELSDLRKSLSTIEQLVRFFTFEDHVTRYPNLNRLAGETPVFPHTLRAIDLILTPTGEIKDNASPELATIRRELRDTSIGLSKRLYQLLKQAQQEGLVDKDASPTMRDGRLVIPVSPSLKRKIRGIVHDESATGKTVFIEPEELVEANNRIRELTSEERREIIRILTRFTDSIRPEAAAMIDSYELLAEIEFLKAKANLTYKLNAIKPRLENRPQLEWYNAIHPLLYLSLKKQHKEVVPLSIQLAAEKRILIISGPNAGGKSVCLKTVGLIQYMVQCGLMVPLHDSSVMGCFERIFIDIGDEQSIENDLSTYSSHLLNMKFFLKNAQDKTLILIDEFGTGTEPTIGGAIAESCLKRFNAQRAYAVITTHYSNLKHYAEEHEGIINGAMLYDRHEMQPLFKLETGRPGSSFAVEIARKIGLPEEVIKDASEIVGADYIDMDKYLQDIIRDKRYWENKRQQIRLKEKKSEELVAQLEQSWNELNNQRKTILSEAKREASRIFDESNARIELTIREIKEAQAEKERTKLVRNDLKAFREQLEGKNDQPDASVTKLIKKVKNKQPAPPKKEVKKTTFQVNDVVRIKEHQTPGTIVQLKDNKATVVFGMVHSTIPLHKLEHTVQKKQLQQVPSTIGKRTIDEVHEKKLHFKQELDVRGLRGDEALQTVMYYIDDAIMTGVGRVRILHGTGTGALRQLIRKYLGTVQGVRDYHDEHVQFGGAGITVVELD